MIDTYRGRTVLITGGLGFIGSNLAIELASLGAKVTIVDAQLGDNLEKQSNVDSIPDCVSIKIADVRDESQLEELIKGQDFIFNLAAQVSHVESMRRPLVDLDINCRSLVAILECCRRVNSSVRLVLAGTRQIYGKPQFLPVTESHPINPIDVNGINKWAAERYATLYSNVYGMSTICLRLTNTYGPRMDISDGTKGFVGVFIGQVIQGKPLKIFGDGEQRRDFNFVSDVVHAFMIAGSRRDISGRSFNLGHMEHYSLNEFVNILSECIPLESERIPFPPHRQVIDIGDCYSDFSDFHHLTGWSPKIGLREGLQRTIAYFLHTHGSLRC